MSLHNQKVDLFLVGAMKSGTTTLAKQLDQHPEIFMSQDPWKEPRYFVKEMNYARGMDWYHGLFATAPSECRIRGEASQHYSWFPHYRGVPARISKYNPDARILYILRDPIERSVSHYWWDVQWSGEGRSMRNAFQAMPCLTDVSHYALQLDQYLEHFQTDQIHVVTLEALRDNPQATLAGIFAWLGVDPAYPVPKLDRRENVSSSHSVNRAIGAAWFSHLRGRLAWRWAKGLVPPPVRQRMLRAISRPVAKTPPDTDAIDYMRETFAPQVAELSQRLQRDFPEWKWTTETSSVALENACV